MKQSFSRQDLTHHLATAMAIGLGLLLVLMPFHAALSVVLGSKLGHMSVIQAWKEVVIVLLAILALLYWPVSGKFPWRFDTLNITAAAIIVVSLAVSLLRPLALTPLAYGIKTDLLPLVLFFIAQIPIGYYSWRRLSWLVLTPATLVAAGAIAQGYFVPIDWLIKLGYNQNTINPVQIVDGSLSLMRSFSTLGGPNQLGAYLILPLCLAIALVVRERKLVLSLLVPVLAAGLVLSYSRSAWIGAAVATLLTVILCVPRQLKILFSAAAAVIALTIFVSVSHTIHSSTITAWQHLLLHGRNFNNQIQSADVARVAAAKSALHDIAHHPFGYGLGTAGPASQHAGITRVTENWYLQIGLEIGWLGLIGFAVFFVAMGIDLIRKGSLAGGYFTSALLAALVGILIANLFLHALADSTLAIVLFSLLGLSRWVPA